MIETQLASFEIIWLTIIRRVCITLEIHIGMKASETMYWALDWLSDEWVMRSEEHWSDGKPIARIVWLKWLQWGLRTEDSVNSECSDGASDEQRGDYSVAMYSMATYASICKSVTYYASRALLQSQSPAVWKRIRLVAIRQKAGAGFESMEITPQWIES